MRWATRTLQTYALPTLEVPVTLHLLCVKQSARALRPYAARIRDDRVAAQVHLKQRATQRHGLDAQVWLQLRASHTAVL